jgi:hypothetical protein
MKFKKNITTGLKLIIVNIIASILTAIFGWIFALALIGFSVVQTMLAPVLIVAYILIYIVMILFIGGWTANTMFGWK